MTKLNLFWSSQTELCSLILHPHLFELVALTFHSLLMLAISGSQSHATQPWTSMSQTSADPPALNFDELAASGTFWQSVQPKTLLSAFVLSKLDSCNSLLCGSLQFILDKLQTVQNSAARLVMKSRTGYQSAQGLTTRFHPCASTLSPTLLLSILLSIYSSTTLPDTSVHPRTHTSSVFLSSELSHLVKSAFSFTGPTQWNLLPCGLRHSESSPAFKTALKTHLSRSAY